MVFTPLERDPLIERRIKRRRNIRTAAFALIALIILFLIAESKWHTSGNHGIPNVATKPVTVVSTHDQSDGVHVVARLDAASPGGTSHELSAVIPASQWQATHVLWACYPPADPAKGTLRTPFDSDCANFVAAK